eukprot:PRCOL_00004071-RA
MAARRPSCIARRASLQIRAGGGGVSTATTTLRSAVTHAVTDRGSAFAACAAWPVRSVREAERATAALRREYASASGIDHAMSAYRVPDGVTKAGKQRFKAAFDDDGEPRGGTAARAELNALRACGVAVVVTRVWGGENLGKRRFEHIRERTRALLQELGFVPDSVMAGGSDSNAYWGAAGTARVLGGSGGPALPWAAPTAARATQTVGTGAVGAVCASSGCDAAAEEAQRRKRQRVVAAAAAEERRKAAARAALARLLGRDKGVRGGAGGGAAGTIDGSAHAGALPARVAERPRAAPEVIALSSDSDGDEASEHARARGAGAKRAAEDAGLPRE